MQGNLGVGERYTLKHGCMLFLIIKKNPHIGVLGVLLSRQIFVATNIILWRQNKLTFVATKVCLSRQTREVATLDHSAPVRYHPVKRTPLTSRDSF